MYSAGMNDSPQDSPDRPGQIPFAPRPGSPAPVTWASIGFAVGTLLFAPFILSVDLRGKLLGGAISGGTLGALIGLAYGAKRSRQSQQSAGANDQEHAQACPLCGATTKANASRCLSCGERLLQDDSDDFDREPEPWWNRIPSAVGFAIILGLLAAVFIFGIKR